VFERFYRIQGTPGDGTGLGLAIVKEVAQRHGASLSIETPDVGGSGTRVVVRFPRTTAPPAPAASDRRARPTAEV
jgi:two-component system sensor histidine kinase TctE